MEAMKIVKMQVADLVAADYNPRKIKDEEFIRLKKSIQEFGYVEPIIYNKQTGRIVGGHQRHRALKELGYDEIEVVEVDLNETQEKILNIGLNKIGGAFDMPKLKDLLTEVDTGEYSLDLTGFGTDEIEKMLADDEFFEKPEVEFTEELLEEHNYLVLYFDNQLDWQVAKDKFGITTKAALDSREGYERKGIGRVVRGADVLEMLT